MKMRGPTDKDVDALADAMCQVLNEIPDGGSISDLVRARARIAFQPFALDDNGDLPDLEWALKFVADYEQRERRRFARHPV